MHGHSIRRSLPLRCGRFDRHAISLVASVSAVEFTAWDHTDTDEGTCRTCPCPRRSEDTTEDFADTGHYQQSHQENDHRRFGEAS